MFKISHFSTLTGVVLFVLFSICAAQAAGEIDPTFNGSITTTLSGTVYTSALQPDGKILVGGNFVFANTQSRLAVARFNADGTLDTSFADSGVLLASNVGTVFALALQSSGKIIIAGDFNIVAGQPRRAFARLNADGTLDTTFQPESPGVRTFNGLAVDVKIAPDDRIIVVGSNLTFNNNGQIFNYAIRFNADGTHDTGFQNTAQLQARTVALQPDGKIVIGTHPAFGGSSVNRLNANGSVDASFNSVALTNGAAFTILVQPDGKILIAGEFTRVNGFALSGLARLTPGGAIDTTFSIPGASGIVNDVEIGADGKLYIGGAFNSYGSVMRAKIARLDADGFIDFTFFGPFSLNADVVHDVLPLPNGNVIAVGAFNSPSLTGRVLRLNSMGVVDTSFDAVVGFIQGGSSVFKILQQTDGKILVGGSFNGLNGVNQRLIGRFNADGTRDSTFNFSIANNFVFDIAQQPDGKIVLTGSIPTGTVRLNLDGTVDTTFNAAIGNSGARALQIQTDGKIHLGFRRLNANGSSDSTFNIPNINGEVHGVLLQPDGKAIIAGGFTAINGLGRGRIARLNVDGTLDTTFNPPLGANDTIVDIARQPSDGKLVIVGNFTGVNGVNRPFVARLNADGTLDTGFAPSTNGSVQAVEVEPNGKVVIGGLFTQANSVNRSNVARFNADGSLDFNFITGTNGLVLDVALQSDGRILIGGGFTFVNDSPRFSIARLLSPTAQRSPLFDFDGDLRADLSVFRPSNGNWYNLNLSTGFFFQRQHGTATDLLAPADYDGDGKTDFAYWRPGAADVAAFSIVQSSTNTIRTEIFAQTGDLPISGDFDADGKADLAVYREAAGGGQSFFFYRPSSQPGVNFISIPWGTTGDKPVRGDFDGDGRQDAAVFRPSTGAWFVLFSSNQQFYAVQFGAAGDLPTPADYDGDGRTDVSVFRPSSGGWFRINSNGGGFVGAQFGSSGDAPVAADYDGDGRADIGVWRPANGVWYLLRSTGGFGSAQFGATGDKPAQTAFVR